MFDIKSRRKELGYSLEAIGKMCGVGKSTVKKWETGYIRDMRRDKIALLAAALHVSPLDIIGVDSNTPDDDTVSVHILGSVAAGYNRIAGEEWGEDIDIPRAWLGGRQRSDFFALRVVGNSMYPMYMDGDIVIVKKQTTLNRSGEIGVVMYEDDSATLKKVEYVNGEDWMKLLPINPNYEPVTITGENLEHCRILGIPVTLIRQINEV